MKRKLQFRQCGVRRPSGKAFSAATKGFEDRRKSPGTIVPKRKRLEERGNEQGKFHAFQPPLA
jgi:hypothetical protein